MSLLDKPIHKITVYPEIETTDSIGNPGHRSPDMANGVDVYGVLQPVQSTESNRNGQEVRTQKRFICREFPAGAFGCAAVEGNGLWDIVGEPARRTTSSVTRHVTVILQARAASPIQP